MRNSKTVARVHTHGTLTNKINKANNISLYINVYKTDQFII